MPEYLATKAEFDACLLKYPVVVVDFTASWCGPCQMIAPHFAELEKQYPTVVFKKVDVDANPDTSAAAGISAMPTFIMYKNGKQVDMMRGVNHTQLQQMIAKHAPPAVKAEPTKPKVTTDSHPGYLATQAEFLDCLRQHSAVIVDFTASWCGPCKMVAPFFAEYAKQYPTVLFKKVDVDANPDTSAAAGISAMPTFIMYKNGKQVDMMRGVNHTQLQQMIAKHAPPAVKAEPTKPLVTFTDHIPQKPKDRTSTELKAGWGGLTRTSTDYFLNDPVSKRQPTRSYLTDSFTENPSLSRCSSMPLSFSTSKSRQAMGSTSQATLSTNPKPTYAPLSFSGITRQSSGSTPTSLLSPGQYSTPTSASMGSTGKMNGIRLTTNLEESLNKLTNQELFEILIKAGISSTSPTNRSQLIQAAVRATRVLGESRG